MSCKFKLGEVVRLASGGPDMTVMDIPTNTFKHVTCQWFDGNDLKSGVFPSESLRYVLEETTVEAKT